MCEEKLVDMDDIKIEINKLGNRFTYYDGSSLNLAFSIAKMAHDGQKDKNGEDYIKHIERVASKFEFLNVSTVNIPKMRLKIVAYLHDVLEDTDVSIQMIKPYFTGDILEAVQLLTRDMSMGYMDYIKELAPNTLARKVKMADLLDNLNMQRYVGWEIEKTIKYVKKYMEAYNCLVEYDKKEIENRN